MTQLYLPQTQSTCMANSHILQTSIYVMLQSYLATVNIESLQDEQNHLSQPQLSAAASVWDSSAPADPPASSALTPVCKLTTFCDFHGGVYHALYLVFSQPLLDSLLRDGPREHLRIGLGQIHDATTPSAPFDHSLRDEIPAIVVRVAAKKCVVYPDDEHVRGLVLAHGIIPENRFGAELDNFSNPPIQ